MRVLGIVLLVMLVACGGTEPRGPEGRYVLQRVAGLATPAQVYGTTIHRGEIHLGKDQTFQDILTFDWMGLPLTDTLRGEFLARGDSVVLYYPDGRRSAAAYDQRSLRFRYGLDLWEYGR